MMKGQWGVDGSRVTLDKHRLSAPLHPFGGRAKRQVMLDLGYDIQCAVRKGLWCLRGGVCAYEQSPIVLCYMYSRQGLASKVSEIRHHQTGVR